MDGFIEERLLEEVSYGFQFGPSFDTRIIPMKNKKERRNANWNDFHWRGTAPYTNIKSEDRDALIGAFMRAHGRAYGFRFRNWFDYQAVGQDLGPAPAGTTPIQLVRTYTQFGGLGFTRPVVKPVAGTVVVYLDTGGGPVAKAGTIDTTTGLFTPTTAWAAGNVSADFEYDVPVRFDTDFLPMTQKDWGTANGECPITEDPNEYNT